MILHRVALVMEAICEAAAIAGMNFTDSCLSGLRFWRERAREWEPRLWDRDKDPRSDAEERHPEG
ncbi:hypothetical protein BV511_07640 [Methylorubrum extorquens]|uniref:hypothetical protein n=1 Tax=Methylorubrum extorquens TaxID=408 RepID=UPI0009729996|nr:hypothetical protein [Methylorubrum extorquens]APX84594.1 hypothetical protein BV511_07640 [Methylorubrum extorquens]